MTRKRSIEGVGILRLLNLLAFLPIASRAPLYGRLLFALATDPRVPAARKALLGLAAAYVVSPIDLVPERLPVVGALDDVAVVVLSVDVFLQGLPEELVDEKLAELGIPRSELDADLARVRRLVPKPLRRAAARVPDALQGLADFARDRGLDRRLRALIMQEGRTEGAVEDAGGAAAGGLAAGGLPAGGSAAGGLEQRQGPSIGEGPNMVEGRPA
jgi:uncharacterized membrane protein YkvA (DUF1232 family)